MKAFQYLAALGLGAAVTLVDAVTPAAMAQPDFQESGSDDRARETPSDVKPKPSIGLKLDDQARVLSGDIIASAVPLVPEHPWEFDSFTTALATDNALAATENSPVAIALEVVMPEPPAVSNDGSKPSADSSHGSVKTPALVQTSSDSDNADIAQAEPAGEVPVGDSESPDPVEQEFIQEGSNSAGSEAPTSEALPDALGDDAQAVDSEVQPAVDSTSATTLVDEQPNLLRPDESDQVSIEVNEAISLEMAIEIARQNSPSIRVRQLQLEQSKAGVDQARAAYAPQFSVNSSLSQSTTFARSEELFEEPSFGLDNNNTSRVAALSANGNARLDYNIIDPDRKAQVEAAEIAVEQAQLTLEQDLAELRLNVSQAYYQLQEADEQVNISEKAVTAAQRSLKDAQALETAGVGTRFAVLQADVQLANEQQNLVNNLSLQQQSRRQLAQILSTPEKLNLTASDPVASAGTWNMTLEQSIIEAYQNRVELDNQLLQRDLSDAQRKIALSSTRPNLSIFAQAGPGVAFNFNRANADTGLDTNVGTRQDTIGYQTGLNFQWLFGDGGASKAAARQQALSKAIAEENFETARDQIRREVEDAFYDLAANLRNISTSEQGVVQADEALRLARLRFQAGVGTQTEVVDAERDLTTAQGNRVSAILNYNRALVAIQRAIGTPLAAPTLEIPAELEGDG